MCTAIRVLVGIRKQWNGTSDGVIEIRGNRKEKEKEKQCGL